MPTIAPWLHPLNFPQIMQAGAQTGLAVRRQAESEAEAGDRLRLAYDTLAQSERRAHEAEMTKRELARASMALRQSQMESLDHYRQGQLAAREELNQERAANMERLGKQFEEREKRLGDQFGLRREDAQAREGRLREQFNRRLGYLADPDVVELRSAQKKLETLSPRRGLLSLGIEALGANTGEIKRLTSRVSELRDKVNSKYGALNAPIEEGAAERTKLRYNPETEGIEPVQ